MERGHARARSGTHQPLGHRRIDRRDRPGRRPSCPRVPRVPGRRPGGRVVERQGDRRSDARRVEPGPLEPRVAQVGDDPRARRCSTGIAESDTGPIGGARVSARGRAADGPPKEDRVSADSPCGTRDRGPRTRALAARPVRDRLGVPSSGSGGPVAGVDPGSAIGWTRAGIPWPVTAEIASTSRPSSRGDPVAGLVGAGEVDLGDDQQLGPLGQRGAVLLQLVADRAVVGDRVGAVDRHGLDQVDQQAGPLDVAEELVPQAVPRRAPLRSGRGCRPRRSDRSRPTCDGAEVGVLGRERIVGDLGMGPRDPREQRRLAGVRQADQADVGDDLQFQGDPALLARLARLGLPRGAVGARLEVGVAVPAAAAPGDDDPVADGFFRSRRTWPRSRSRTIVPGGTSMTRSRRRPAVAVRALAVLAAVGLPVPLAGEVGEVREPVDGAEDDARRRRRRRRRWARRGGRTSPGGS